MNTQSIEQDYPITFRAEDAKTLGEHIAHFNSVELIGMKRVGISNFLRFFLTHKEIPQRYIKNENIPLFVSIDLNDLVEREIYPFWVLTLKRITDAISHLEGVKIDKKHIEGLFLGSIQTQDLFLLIDGIRKTILYLVELNIVPVLFFIRFDRMKDVVTPSFFDNLQGLKDASSHKLIYVFTGDRGLDFVAPQVFSKASLSVFSKNMYIKPANIEDTKIIYKTYKQRYNLSLPKEIEDSVLSLSSGYAQYLQLILIILHERKENFPKDEKELFDILVGDERILLQSEEIWESLSKDEKDVLKKISNNKSIEKEERQKASYLWDCGIVLSDEDENKVFSLLFSNFLNQIDGSDLENQEIHFSKKEHLLYSLLEKNIGNICEREVIVETVWPEYSEFGVSDWAIDRLVARVRSKLKKQKSPYGIVTIRTRGYKLSKEE